MPIDNPKQTDQDVLTELGKLFEEQKAYRYYYERDWFLNIAFFLGHQYLFYNNRSRRLENPQVPEWRVRLVFNYIKPVVISQVARLLKARPTINVLPGSSEQMDIDAAKTAEKVLDYLWRKLNMAQKIRRLALWFSVCGSSFFRVEWNKDAGERIVEDQPVMDPMTGQQVIDEKGQPMFEHIDFNLGEIDVTVMSPFEVYVDPKATTLEDAEYICLIKFFRKDEFLKRWPDKGEKLEFKEEGSSSYHFYENAVLNAFGGYGGGYHAAPSGKQEPGCVVQEWIFKPNKEYQHCRRIYVTNNTLLETIEDPLLKGDFPLFKFDDIVVPGRFFSDGVVQDLRPLNKEYNRTRSQIVEIKNLMAKPKWTVPKGAGLKSNSITSEPGEVIVYNGTLEPKPVTPPQIPQYVFEHAAKVLEDMQNISNVRSVSLRPPSRITSGIAISAMQEQDESAFGPTAQEFEASLEKVAFRMLWLIHQKYEEERLFQIMGRDGQPEVFSFKGSDMGDKFDVIIQTGSALPRSKVAKQELILRLTELGLFGPIEDPMVRQKILRLLEVGVAEDLDSQFFVQQPVQPMNFTEPGQPQQPASGLGDIMPGNPDVQAMRNQEALARS